MKLPHRLFLAASLALIPAAHLHAAPMIESLRVAFVTGDDNLRGDSGLSFKYWLDDRDGSPEEVSIFGYNPASFGSPNPVRWREHTINQWSFSIPPTELYRFRAVGVELVRDDFSDKWKMDGLVVIGVTATGDEYVIYADLEVERYFRPVELGPEHLMRHWKSPLIQFRELHPIDAEFDALAVHFETADDDLRRGSRAYIRILWRDGSLTEAPLIDPALSDEEWSSHSGRSVAVALRHRYDPADIRRVQVLFEGGAGGGRGTDEWGIKAAWVAAFRTTPPLARAEGMADGPQKLIANDMLGWHTIRTGFVQTLEEHPGGIDAFPGPNPVSLRTTINTGRDNKERYSGVYVQLGRPDGTFYELPFVGSLFRSSAFPSNSTDSQTNAVPQSWMSGDFTQFRVRFLAWELRDEIRTSRSFDQWTFDGIELDLRNPAGGAERELISSRNDDHHFSESNSHTVAEIGSSSGGLEEAERIVHATTMWAVIPPIHDVRTAPYYNVSVLPVEIGFPEWYDAFLSRREPFDQERESGKMPGDHERRTTPFERYAFSLGEGETPRLHITPLPPDPNTGERRLALTYRRMLGATDVEYQLQFSGRLTHWQNWLPAPSDVRILPDYINGVEWCQVLVHGELAAREAAFFRVRARRAE